MSKMERLVKIQQLLDHKSVLSAQELMETLEVSRATFRRDLDYLRERLGVPIVWDPGLMGYRLEARDGDERRHIVPGLWLNEKEIVGLLTVIDVLSDLEAESIIGEQVKPLCARLEKLLEQDRFMVEEIRRRIRVIRVGARSFSTKFWQAVVHALMTRKRLAIKYFSRVDGITTEREISPQRLVYYRDNWYLDSFCHMRNDLRLFAVDAIDVVTELEKPAVSVSERAMCEEVESGYGIFSGKKTSVATLKFTPFRARWVAKEIWHPDQLSAFLPDGSYVLKVPYSDDRELVHDILREGKEVEVLEPKELCLKIMAEIEQMRSLYTMPLTAKALSRKL